MAVLNLKLPRMPGLALLPRLLEAAPQLCVIGSGGTPLRASSLPAGLRPRVRSLRKPFLPRQLLEALERLAPKARGASV